jgi:hypothetical protein
LGRDKISRFQTHLRREKKRILYDQSGHNSPRQNGSPEVSRYGAL